MKLTEKEVKATLEFLKDRKPDNVVIIKTPNINAESELKELLETFKKKHDLTEIY